MDHAGRGETILLVDNDPILRDLIARMLNHQGYPVFDACNGEEALATAAQYPDPIHLLVTDAKMPGMGGFRLADLLTVARPEIRVLFISGHYDDSAGVRQGLHQSPRPFLLKPFTQDQLARAVRDTLDQPPEPQYDPFALILTDPRIAAEPLQDNPSLQGIPRALRFRVRLSLRYRAAREFAWHDGVTENLSRSGVLFQTISPLEPKTPVEMFLTLPTGVAEGSVARLRCQGEIVRVQPPETAGMLPRVAAAVETYVVAAV